MTNNDGELGTYGTWAVETACIAVFTAEFSMRLLTTPNYLAFIRSMWTYIDILTILPYFLENGGLMGDAQSAQ
eukprot:gene41801-28553_t